MRGMSDPQETSLDGGRVAHGREPGRGPGDIRAIVIAHRDEARACYDMALVAHPGIEGDLVIRWMIDPKGTVSQVTNDTTRSQILEPSLIACIGDVLTKSNSHQAKRAMRRELSIPSISIRATPLVRLSRGLRDE